MKLHTPVQDFNKETMIEHSTNLTNETILIDTIESVKKIVLVHQDVFLSFILMVAVALFIKYRLKKKLQKSQQDHDIKMQQSQQDYDKKIYKLQQAKKEMDNLVSKLYANLDDEVIFHKYDPYTDKKEDRQRRDGFWNDIKQNLHLTPKYLRDAIELYLKYQAFGLGKKTIKSYKEAEAKLRELIIQRYDELDKQIKDLEDEEI